jgi:tetraspanin-3
MSYHNQFVAKSVILLLLILLWVAAGCFIFIGAYALHAGGDITHVARSSYVFVPAIICLSVGVILFILGLLGCFACTMDNRPMLVIFFSLILVVFLGQIAAIACGVIFRDKLASNVEKALDNELENYAEDESLSREIDFIQSTYRCCGVRNYTDWYSSSWYKQHNETLPGSCCQGGNCTSEPAPATHKTLNEALEIALNQVDNTIRMGVKKLKDMVSGGGPPNPSTVRSTLNPTVSPTGLPQGALFKEPCLTKLEIVLKRNLGWMASLAILFAVLEVMGLIATFIVMRRSNDIDYQRFGIVTEGLNV